MFLFGASTSAHQVEGNNCNDWSEWEQSERRKRDLEQKIGKRVFRTNFPEQVLNSHPSPLERENYISGKAIDHYNLFEKDFDLAQSLGHTAHRLSIEWSRVEPQEGKCDEKAIKHYGAVIDALRKRGIEPFVTLWHFTNPLWISAIGGVLNPLFPEYFARYTSLITRVLKNVRYWITINEPEVYATNSFLKGKWPPQKKNPATYLRAREHFINAHKMAYEAIKRTDPRANIGIAKNNIYFDTPSKNPQYLLAKKVLGWWWNFYFLNRIRNYQDFIGLNYYFYHQIGNRERITLPKSDLGWTLKPSAIYDTLLDLKKYNKPIFITESGLADIRDAKRAWLIEETLRGMKKAISEGVRVRGYFHWSLLDNFEWAHGFWPRFGLIEVNYKTLERKIRPSAHIYKRFIETW